MKVIKQSNKSSPNCQVSGNRDQASKIARHTLFYTICQAAFYIMCFRGKECVDHYREAVAYYVNLEEGIEDGDDLLYDDPRLIDISAKRWNRLCSHHLNPLKYCLESVRGEFLLLSDRFDLIESDLLGKMIIEDRKMASGIKYSASANKAKKVSLISTAATLESKRMNGGVGGLGRGSNPLDSFFPFDPYLLRRSYEFVDPYYRHWTGSSSTEDSFDPDSDDDDENNTEVVVEEESVTRSILVGRNHPHCSKWLTAFPRPNSP